MVNDLIRFYLKYERIIFNVGMLVFGFNFGGFLYLNVTHNFWIILASSILLSIPLMFSFKYISKYLKSCEKR